jgi:UDP-2,3-diacylglucosamine pyrophosphatase LpxH
MTSLAHPHPGAAWHETSACQPQASRRLSQVFDVARRIPFDDHTPIVIFSDHHRGNRSKLDPFAANHGLFVRALKHYYDRGFTYIEAGDGDELWKGWRFADVERAHSEVFDLLHRFHWQERLHLLFGNHEELPGGYQQDKGGLPAIEGLVLERLRTDQRLLVVHGHQADPRNDRDTVWSRRFVRHLWTPMQSLGLASLSGAAFPVSPSATDPISRRIESWAAAQRQLVICGHTHRPVFALPGAPPYFNTGACLHPGQITGIEIAAGRIQLVRWTLSPAHWDGAVRRHAASPALLLDNYR